ncbi:hypothetical protein [Paludisphaera mucosa]|uniref:Uncharacterized protein n=1 Tax=Paludisphaera mucosa TaxID=3030827 RepID=A0ABT6FBH3_9BACT|nr:hypothetical protein [Paludisphaera mucosa]MDG3004944.1 hypothetical protein [Paludisphaera mucosa]
MATGSESGGPHEAAGESKVGIGEATAAEPRPAFPPLAAGLLAGLAAGLLAFAFGEFVYGAYEPKAVARQFQGVTSNLPTPETQDAAMVKNARLADAGLGALLGLFLGLAGGLVRGDARRGAVGGVVGVVLGGIVGGLAPTAVLPASFWFRRRHDPDLLVAGTITQAVLWGLIAAAAGAAFGVAQGGVKAAPRFATLAFAGTALGALIYGAVGAFGFPLAGTDQALATERAPRLLAHLLAAVAAGTAVGLGLTGGRRRP